MKKVLFTLAAAGLAAVLSTGSLPVDACVGKTVFLGRMPGREQEVLTEMFSWMVSERTGTTIQIKAFPDSRSMQAALQTAEVDLYIEDQGVALRDILGRSAAGNVADQRETVRREYEQRFNLVWLEPWGMTGNPAPAAVAGPGLVAPVIRKDTLKKFPALSRLVNKLSGKVDNATLARLVQESEKRPAREVVKQFLKEQRLI